MRGTVLEDVRKNASYNASSGRLTYRGTMSDQQRDALKQGRPCVRPSRRASGCPCRA